MSAPQDQEVQQLHPLYLSPDHPSYNTQALERQKRTEALMEKYPGRFHVMPETAVTVRAHTLIRNRDAPRSDFLFYSEQLFRGLIEYSLDQCLYEPKTIYTPTGNVFEGQTLSQQVIGVSIMRSGECLEHALMECVRGVKLGKILVQRDESTSEKEAKLFYSKLPEDIGDSTVLLLDPMLASGSSARLCIKVLLEHGIKEENIVFVNLIAAPVGVEVLLKEFSKLQLVTSMLDRELNAQKFIIEGIGDYGDNFFGTN